MMDLFSKKTQPSRKVPFWLVYGRGWSPPFVIVIKTPRPDSGSGKLAVAVQAKIVPRRCGQWVNLRSALTLSMHQRFISPEVDGVPRNERLCQNSATIHDIATAYLAALRKTSSAHLLRLCPDCAAARKDAA